MAATTSNWSTLSSPKKGVCEHILDVHVRFDKNHLWIEDGPNSLSCFKLERVLNTRKTVTLCSSYKSWSLITNAVYVGECPSVNPPPYQNCFAARLWSYNVFSKRENGPNLTFKVLYKIIKCSNRPSCSSLKSNWKNMFLLSAEYPFQMVVSIRCFYWKFLLVFSGFIFLQPR